MTTECAEPICFGSYPWYCLRRTDGASVALNSYLSSMTKWQKHLGAKKWIRGKLSSAISNGDFFATLFFCLPLGCGRRPRWDSLWLCCVPKPRTPSLALRVGLTAAVHFIGILRHGDSERRGDS